MQAPPDLEVDLDIARSLPAAGCQVAEAERYTRRLATRHYENFHVASWLLPRRLHRHFYNLYAYCRWADDLGDEVADPLRSVVLLDWWERELELCYAGRPSHPVFIALAPTIRAFDIPIDPFRDLLMAFRQDQTGCRYPSWEQLLLYCRYSANPVGRLVLYLCGYRDAERQRLSDAVCTALQLSNFWQDVSRDLEKGRLYIPLDSLADHGLSADDIHERRFDSRYVSLMKNLIARTRVLFAEGAPLSASVDAALRVDIDLFSQGGLSVLEAIEEMGYNTLQQRPAIRSGTRLRLLGRAIMGRTRAAFSPVPAKPSGQEVGNPGVSRLDTDESSMNPSSVPLRFSVSKSHDSALASESFAECRRVARSAASNFYYAFYMLPRRKRDALCALYAFMRLVDDVSDGPDSPIQVNARESAPENAPESIAQKRAGLARWRVRLDDAFAGKTSGHPILPAFSDTVNRFRIPARYFHDLISGAEMDLTETRYATFERLREYCYRVAGTVGLTCLHVFGFTDPHATELAEQLGVAFQLTNILRDVGADLALGRVYLPAEDMEQLGCSVEDLSAGVVAPPVKELLHLQAERAWHLYGEGSRLISRIDRDSRAALWALTRIYSTLLARIEENDFDVFSSRVRLTSAEKTRILLRARLGWWSEADVVKERNRDRRRAGGAFLGRRAG